MVKLVQLGQQHFHMGMSNALQWKKVLINVTYPTPLPALLKMRRMLLAHILVPDEMEGKLKFLMFT